MLEVVSGQAQPRGRFTRHERGSEDAWQTSPAEMQGRCFSRHRATRGDGADLRRLLRTLAARVEHRGSDGGDGEGHEEEVLPQARRGLDGAQTDENRHREERSGDGDGCERDEHSGCDLLHLCLPPPPSRFAADLSCRLDDMDLINGRAIHSNSIFRLNREDSRGSERRVCRPRLTTRNPDRARAVRPAANKRARMNDLNSCRRRFTTCRAALLPNGDNGKTKVNLLSW